MIYLYIKTCNHCGLKYLGKTIKDPFKYKGSGKYWLRHLNKHGENVTTDVIFETENEEELKNAGVYFSELYDVVKSKKWANLKEENGGGGFEYINNSKELRTKSVKGRKENALKRGYWFKPGTIFTHSEQQIQKQSKMMKENNPNKYGLSEKHKINIGKGNLKKYIVIFANNEIEEINNLKEFSIKYNISLSALRHAIFREIEMPKYNILSIGKI
jgi:hypothetical protein